MWRKAKGNSGSGNLFGPISKLNLVEPLPQ
jgi:hypothetical protein